MATIAETNAANAPEVRTEETTLAGVVDPAAAAKTAREAARAARETAKALAATASEAARVAREAKAAAPAAPTARDAVREIDAEILGYAGELADRIAGGYPEGMRAEILSLVSNQLHHLASPKTGWVGSLPVPNRSEWR
jgi:hypothetical protein